jgi:glycosyltransferase involved in cell wall biosynthesis
MDRLDALAVILPARSVTAALRPLVNDLANAGIGALILVDDGIPFADKESLAFASEFRQVYVVGHAVNRGKGRALKTGFEFALALSNGFQGVVTADADGQHSCEDILRVGKALLVSPDRAVLGTRRFDGDVPMRSRFGNDVTRRIFRFVSGHALGDTQSGLRAFPVALLPELLDLEGERYEYEMNVLAYLCATNRPPAEVAIRTIYEEGNRTSHFKPLLDSFRIYRVLARYCVPWRSVRRHQ